MKKLLILTTLLVCPLQQAQPFENRTNAILYGAASVAAGVGTYLSYRQAKKITATLNNPEELEELSAEEIEKLRKQVTIYYMVTGGCAATAAITGILACKSGYNWHTKPRLNKLVEGAHIKILPNSDLKYCLDQNKQQIKIFNKDGSNNKEYSIEDLKEYKKELGEKNGDNYKEIEQALISIKNLSPFIDNIFKTFKTSPEKLTNEQVLALLETIPHIIL